MTGEHQALLAHTACASPPGTGRGSGWINSDANTARPRRKRNTRCLQTLAVSNVSSHTGQVVEDRHRGRR